MSLFQCIRKIIFFVSCCILFLSLTACQSNKKDLHWYLLHPLAVKAMLNRCSLSEDYASKNCLLAYQAAKAIDATMTVLAENPQTIGLRIMDLQTKLADLQTTKADNPENQATIDKQKTAINQKLAFYYHILRVVYEANT